MTHNPSLRNKYCPYLHHQSQFRKSTAKSANKSDLDHSFSAKDRYAESIEDGVTSRGNYIC
jgi:hypothetical protein